MENNTAQHIIDTFHIKQLWIFIISMSFVHQNTFITLTIYAIIFHTAMYFQRAYLLCSKQGKFFENAIQYGKHMRKWYVVPWP